MIRWKVAEVGASRMLQGPVFVERRSDALTLAELLGPTEVRIQRQWRDSRGSWRRDGGRNADEVIRVEPSGPGR